LGVTDVALKEYLEGLIEALRREIELQRESDQRAIELATNTLSTRLATMNEFRDQIRDERGTYVRVDTFRWTVTFIVLLIGVAVAVIALVR
jgi:hypothetical protein